MNTTKRRTKKATTKLARVMKKQGRKYTWLADRLSYSVSTVGAAARGERIASDSFYKLATYELGEDVTP